MTPVADTAMATPAEVRRIIVVLDCRQATTALVERATRCLALQTLPPERRTLIRIADRESELPTDDGNSTVEDVSLRSLVAHADFPNAELVAFLDCRSLPREDFLANALEVSRTHRRIGLMGGRVDLEFEKKPCTRMLGALQSTHARSPNRPLWANRANANPAFPFGPGFLATRAVVEALCGRPMISSVQAPLSMSGLDYELSRIAVEQGLGTGIFPELHLTRIISSRETTRAGFTEYLEQIHYVRSKVDLAHDATPGAVQRRSRSQVIAEWLHDLTISENERRLQAASRRGRSRAALEHTSRACPN